MTQGFVRLLTASLLAFLCLGLALESRAQGTIHKVDLSLKIVSQGMSGDNAKGDKHSGNSKDVFSLCLGQPPTKTQGIYFGAACADPNDNSLMLYDTNGGGSKPIGSMTFNLGLQILTTADHGNTLKSVKLPFTADISCGDSGEIHLTGIANVTLTPSGLDYCPTGLKGKVTGVGQTQDLGEFVIDAGSTLNLGKPLPAN